MKQTKFIPIKHLLHNHLTVNKQKLSEAHNIYTN